MSTNIHTNARADYKGSAANAANHIKALFEKIGINGQLLFAAPPTYILSISVEPAAVDGWVEITAAIGNERAVVWAQPKNPSFAGQDTEAVVFCPPRELARGIEIEDYNAATYLRNFINCAARMRELDAHVAKLAAYFRAEN